MAKLQRYLRTLRKYWWMVVATAAAGLIWSVWAEFGKPETFASHGRILVSGIDHAFADGQQRKSLAESREAQKRFIGSIQVRQKAAEHLERKLPELLASPVAVTVVQEAGSSRFNVIANGGDPAYTQAFLNACLESSVTLLQERVGQTQNLPTSAPNKTNENDTVKADIQLMDYASSPESTKPKFSKTLFKGGLTGIIIGLEILFLIAICDGRFMSSVEVSEKLPQALLQVIPHVVVSPGDQMQVLSNETTKGKVLAAYQNLRSTLHFMEFEGARPKTFLVTSAVAGEGASSVAANLAAVLAAAGSRTLLVDADLQNGRLHHEFAVRAAPGLSEIAKGIAKWNDCLVLTKVPNLFLLPCGYVGIKPSDYFMSGAANRLLSEIYQSDFEHIIFDSASVFAGADTVSLAPKIDATLVVIRGEESLIKTTRDAVGALRKRQTNVLGLIYIRAF